MAASQVKDYYETLGLTRGADEKAIRAAFRKLARKYHPDVNRGDSQAENRFKEINEAYDTLSDSDSRKLYDRFGPDWQRYRDAGFTGDEPTGFSRPGGTADTRSGGSSKGGTPFRVELDDDGSMFSDLFSSVRGSRRGADRFGFGRPTRSKGDDIDVAITVSFDEAFRGTTRRLDVQAPETCGTCKGTGFVRHAPCPTCDASGTTLRTKTVEVKIPAGVATGSRIRIAGQGGIGFNGGANGDVWLNITVRPSNTFERVGDDLKTEVPVSVYTLLLGGEAVVPTPTGKVALTIPPESQNGRVFRLRNQGMPKLKGEKGQRGDLLARITAELPTNLSDRERSLFAELRDQRPADAG